MTEDLAVQSQNLLSYFRHLSELFVVVFLRANVLLQPITSTSAVLFYLVPLIHYFNQSNYAPVSCLRHLFFFCLHSHQILYSRFGTASFSCHTHAHTLTHGARRLPPDTGLLCKITPINHVMASLILSAKLTRLNSQQPIMCHKSQRWRNKKALWVIKWRYHLCLTQHKLPMFHKTVCDLEGGEGGGKSILSVSLGDGKVGRSKALCQHNSSHTQQLM